MRNTKAKRAEKLSARFAQERDAGPKFAIYEVHGMREYWMLDPKHFEHRFYQREGELLVDFANGGKC
jgi:Uma2 family endonuclease